MSGSEHPIAAASLTGSLLARRGGARPAMRRQLAGMHGMLPGHEDLGWNDMGEEPPVEIQADVLAEPGAPVTPINDLLHVLAERINTKARPRKTSGIAPRASLAPSRKAAFTLRIDEERHLRLRLLSAMTNRSAQRLLIDALDELIARNDQVKDLARQVENNVPEPKVKWGS